MPAGFNLSDTSEVVSQWYTLRGKVLHMFTCPTASSSPPLPQLDRDFGADYPEKYSFLKTVIYDPRPGCYL